MCVQSIGLMADGMVIKQQKNYIFMTNNSCVTAGSKGYPCRCFCNKK